MAKIPNSKHVSNFEFLISRHGFTLLETVVALALIVAAAIGPLSLTAKGIVSAKFGRSKLIALNLSQEGLELIRHTRENNILAGYDWRVSGSCAGCGRLDDGSFQADVFTNQNGGLLPVASSCLVAPLRVAIDPSDPYYGIYFQSAGVVSSSPTPYCRVITISTPAANQMNVVSRVTWTEGGFSRQIQMQEILYNWQ